MGEPFRARTAERRPLPLVQRQADRNHDGKLTHRRNARGRRPLLRGARQQPRWRDRPRRDRPLRMGVAPEIQVNSNVAEKAWRPATRLARQRRIDGSHDALSDGPRARRAMPCSTSRAGRCGRRRLQPRHLATGIQASRGGAVPAARLQHHGRLTLARSKHILPRTAQRGRRARSKPTFRRCRIGIPLPPRATSGPSSCVASGGMRDARASCMLLGQHDLAGEPRGPRGMRGKVEQILFLFARRRQALRNPRRRRSRGRSSRPSRPRTRLRAAGAPPRRRRAAAAPAPLPLPCREFRRP